MFGTHFICSAVQRIQFWLGKTMLSGAVYPVCLCGHLHTSTLSLLFRLCTCRVKKKKKEEKETQRDKESHHLTHNSCAITGYSF